MKQWNAKHLLILIELLTSKMRMNIVITLKYTMFEKHKWLQDNTFPQNNWKKH